MSSMVLVAVVMVIALPSLATPYLETCIEHQDCISGQYCSDAGQCQCKEYYVRAASGICEPIRRKGEKCLDNIQCSSLDPQLLCHDGRCDCPDGVRQSNGSCPEPPTPPPRRPPPPGRITIRGNKPEDDPTPAIWGSVAGPLATCVCIFLFFCVIITIITYCFRVQSQRQRNSYDIQTISTPTRRPTTLGEIPPAYTTFAFPPSYEQATLYRNQRNQCSFDQTPMSTYTLTSPDTPSTASYSSILTRSLHLTPTESITDLTAPSQRLHEENNFRGYRY